MLRLPSIAFDGSFPDGLSPPGLVAVAPPRVVRAPQIVSRAAPTAASEDDESTASEEEEDEAEIERRRAAVRARAAARRRELEEEALPIQSESESESEPERARVATARSRPVAPPVAPAESSDGSSSWETDTDASDSEDDPRKMIKPVFVPKKARETLAEIAALALALAARGEARAAPSAEELWAFVSATAAQTAHNFSSMQQDMAHGRMTEIDQINGW